MNIIPSWYGVLESTNRGDCQSSKIIDRLSYAVTSLLCEPGLFFESFTMVITSSVDLCLACERNPQPVV